MIKSKRSQASIWIIVAVVIVAIIALFFLLRGKGVIDIFQPTPTSPQNFIEKCVRDSALEAVSIMLPQGGYISPTNYKLYQNNKVAYLCYNNNYYFPCIMQQPVYLEFLEQEIHNFIEPKLKDCFFSLKQEYQDKKYSVNDGVLDFDVELNPKEVKIDIEKKFEVSRNEETKRYENFRVKLNTGLYDLAVIAQEIASQEAKFCNFEYLGYSLLYPSYSIEKDQVGSEETASDIYIIREKITGKELLIAIRSCAMPGGL